MKAVVFWVFCVLLPVWCAACAQQAPASASASSGASAPESTVETLSTLNGGPLPPRTLTDLLPPTTSETLDELRLILAEQEHTRHAMSVLDFDARTVERFEKGGHIVTLENLVQVVRGADNAVLVSVEQSDAPMVTPSPSGHKEVFLQNSGAPLVSRGIRLPELAVSWRNVLQPLLELRREEDWRRSKSKYDGAIEGQFEGVNPGYLSFGFGGVSSALENYVEQVLAKGDEYWWWDITHEPHQLIRISEYSRLTPDFCDFTFVVDMAHGGVVLEAAWRPRGKQGPYRIARNAFAEYEGVYVPMEHTVQEFDGAGNILKENVVTFLKYKASRPDRRLTLDDLQAPQDALYVRALPDLSSKPEYLRKGPSGFVPVEQPEEFLRSRTGPKAENR